MEDNQLPEITNDNDRIIEVNIEEQMKTAYIDYSMSVIVGRALPDVRDGFKPVHRRVLYAMSELGNSFNKPFKKSARIVGEVMGKYHPHGDSAIYDTLVRMAQEWTMRYTLVDRQGNFGNQDGDPPAAMRYTEARLQRISEAMLDDIEKETVDYQLNFDDSLQEPTVLPTRIPQLLINGSSGIAVGMATNMMPHNLNEVIDGCIAYVENRAIPIEELMNYVKAPDFPTGGIIYGMEGVKQGLLTGRGRVVVRGRCNIEVKPNGREMIVITEVPYQVSRDTLTDRIGQLAINKIVEGISDVGNQSNKDGTRIVVELKKDVVAQVVINQLYKFTELQTSYGINNVALSMSKELLEKELQVGEDLLHSVSHTEKEIVHEIIGEIQQKKQPDRSFGEYINRQGATAYLESSYVPVINDEGILTHIHIFIRDITPQKVVEKKLTAQAASISNLIEKANAIIIGVDTRGYITDWNEYSSKITGFEKEEVFAQKFSNVLLTKEEKYMIRYSNAKRFLGIQD